MKNNRKKKAFTLTELLVVVIVIGVLAAVVLPKFSKVIETRKTTEAEEMMAAVRTEQEKRCALDKAYTADAATVNLASLNTKNFNYTLKNTGIEAASTGKYGYTLKMPSYRDGRLCCDSAEQCAKLNKNYPLCSELTAKADYTSGTECAATVPDTPAPTYDCTSAKVVSRTCPSGCGTQTRSATCNTSNGQWEYGDWNPSDCAPEPPAETRACENGSGTQTRSALCRHGDWEMGDWIGTCTPTCDMESKEVLASMQNCEVGGHNPNWQAGTWNKTTCACECPTGTTMDAEGACIKDYTCEPNQREKENCEMGGHEGFVGTWSDATCSCTCQEGSTWDAKNGECEGGCWSIWKYASADVMRNCIKGGGTWYKGSCLCVCPEGSWMSPNTYECVRSKCSTGTPEYDIQACQTGVGPTGVKGTFPGTWDPDNCTCNCPRGYSYSSYHQVCVRDADSSGSGNYDGDDRDDDRGDCGSDDATCSGWDEDAWDNYPDYDDYPDWDYDFDPGWD